MSRSRAIAILIIVGFVLYFNVFFNSFLWDDEVTILNNPSIQSFSNIPNFFTMNFLSNVTNTNFLASYYRPVTSTVQTILYVLFGPHPFFFHFFQISIHILNSVLIYLMFCYLYKNKSLPLFLSLIFLVHPMNVEAVSWISATQEVFFFFIGILALLYVVKYQELNLKDLFFINLLVFLSMLIKESGVIFFLLIFTYLLKINKKSAYLNLFFSTITLFIYTFIRFAVDSLYVSGTGLFPIMRVSFLTRLLNIPKMFFYYLSTFFYPVELAISHQWVIIKPDINNFYIPLIFLISCFFLFFYILCRLKNNIFTFFFIWFCIGILLHLQIVPLNMTVSERWFYFPMVGLLGMIGVLLNKIYVVHNKLIKTILIVIIILFSLRSFIRTFDWRNGLTLFSRDIIKSQESFDIQNNLGVELFRKGRIDEAKPYFEESVKLAPYWWVNWNNLGAYFHHKKDYKIAELYYKKSIKNGDYELAYENYALILILQRKIQEAKKFVNDVALIKFPLNQRLISFQEYLNSPDIQNRSFNEKEF